MRESHGARRPRRTSCPNRTGSSMSAKDLSDLKPVYLIYGSEELLLNNAVRRLRERLAEVADLDFNYDVFDGESSSADEVVAAANTLPFMSDRRLVVLRNTDKMPTSALGVLAEYASDPNPETCLVLVATKIAKNTKLFKAVDKLKGTFEYAAPKRNEYPAEVVKLFAARGKSVDLDGAEALVRAIGRDLRRLSTEVDKVVAYTGDAERLSREEVEAVVAVIAPPSVFDLLDAIGARDARSSLRLLAALVSAGEPVQRLWAMALRHTRSLVNARALLDRGASTGEMSRAMGSAEWQVRNLVKQAQRFDAEELKAALVAAADVEAKMKTSQGDPRLVFEAWVVQVCTRP